MEEQTAPSSSPSSSNTQHAVPSNPLLDPRPPSPSTSASISNSDPQSEKCAHCKTAAPEPSTADSELAALKPCSKCHTALYCSRECAKAGWKVHKKTCAVDAQRYALSAAPRPAAAPRLPKKEGHRGGLQKWQFDT